MGGPSTGTASRFAEALDRVPADLVERQRLARSMIARADPLERMASARLLGEAVAQVLESRAAPSRPLVLLMDRAGGGEGARAAASVISLVGERWPGASLVHVAFSTPHRGLGVLLRNNLAQAGARAGVVTDVVARNRPAEGMRISEEDADWLLDGCDLIVTYAPCGSAGLSLDGGNDEIDDPLVERSHACVLAFPDPEAAVADLDAYESMIGTEPGLEAILFAVLAEADGRHGEIGRTILGPDGDARDRLWVLLDNARRYRYRLVVEPMRGDHPAGGALVCPCRRVLEEGLVRSASVTRVVPAGSHLAAVARGKATLV